MKPKRVAVFGATGPTGVFLTRELLSRGLEVRVVSRSRKNLEKTFLDDRVGVFPADLMIQENALDAAEGCQLVFHCVGLPAEHFEKHLDLTKKVLKGLEAVGARGVLLSSFWSYGPRVDQETVREDARRNPASRKEEIRLKQEELFLKKGHCVVSLPDFYGPRADIGFLNPALRAIAAGNTANWVGDLDGKREFIFVPDIATPLVDLATMEEAYGERWNLAGPGVTTAREVLETASVLSNTELKVRNPGKLLFNLLSLFSSEVRAIKDLYPLYMNPPILDTTKLRGLIGDYEITPYDEGLSHTLDWIRVNPE